MLWRLIFARRAFKLSGAEIKLVSISHGINNNLQQLQRIMLVHSHNVSSLNLLNSSGIGSGGCLFIVSIDDSDGVLSKKIQPNMWPINRPQTQQTECWWGKLFLLLHTAVKDNSIKCSWVYGDCLFASNFITRYFFENYVKRLLAAPWKQFFVVHSCFLVANVFVISIAKLKVMH